MCFDRYDTSCGVSVSARSDLRILQVCTASDFIECILVAKTPKSVKNMVSLFASTTCLFAVVTQVFIIRVKQIVAVVYHFNF